MAGDPFFLFLSIAVENKTLHPVFEPRDVKIDEESLPDYGQFHVSEQLCLMNAQVNAAHPGSSSFKKQTGRSSGSAIARSVLGLRQFFAALEGDVGMAIGIRIWKRRPPPEVENHRSPKALCAVPWRRLCESAGAPRSQLNLANPHVIFQRLWACPKRRTSRMNQFSSRFCGCGIHGRQNHVRKGFLEPCMSDSTRMNESGCGDRI